jgi:hypothetical protein
LESGQPDPKTSPENTIITTDIAICTAIFMRIGAGKRIVGACQDEVDKGLEKTVSNWIPVAEKYTMGVLTQIARSRAASPVPHVFSNGPTLTKTQHAMSRPPIPNERREMTAAKILMGFLKYMFAGVGLT